MDSRAWLATISSDLTALGGEHERNMVIMFMMQMLSQSSNNLIYFRGYTTFSK